MSRARLGRRATRAGQVALLLALAACTPATHPLVQLHALVARVACTHADQVRGLRGDSAPPPGNTQLFVFDRQVRHGLTMAGLPYDLDIVWLTGRGAVTRVDANVSHVKILGVSQVRTALARYALELRAGDAAREGLRAGAAVRGLAGACVDKREKTRALTVVD